ncbi:MAG TPA: ABC transporter substrate-binding protein [Acidimicrobiales bacterium]|jgi:ABC-type branched-subunit amino acid transport system substrate-binding protein
MTVLSVSALALFGIAVGSLNGVAGAAGSTPGVTSTQITIGASVPLSGIAASYAPVSAAANAVFKWVNTHGKVNGRTIKYVRLDDCYDLASYGLGCTAGASVTTLSQNQVLVAQDHVFATVGSLGTAAEESVVSYLKQNGVPQLFVNSGSKAWDNPSQDPDLFGYQTSYNAEGKIFAHFIKTHYAGDTVGFIGQNDDFGANGLLGLQDGGISIATSNSLTYNAADAITGSTSDIQADVATLAQDKCQVVVLDSVPGFTTGILEVAHALGYSPTWIISNVGADPTSVNYVGEAGAYTLDYFPAVTDTGDPWIPWIRKVLLADKADFPTFTQNSILTGNELYGAGFAVAFVEALKAEGRNVTRAGFIKAMLSTKFADPAITPLKFSGSNHQGLQGGVIAKIAANGSKAPVVGIPVNGTVYFTGNSKASPLNSTKTLTISPIPAWLKG